MKNNNIHTFRGKINGVIKTQQKKIKEIIAKTYKAFVFTTS